MRRHLAIFLPLLLLWWLVLQLNHYLAPWRMFVSLGGLFIAFVALQLPQRIGLIAALFAGLICDASQPVQFGFHAFLFGLATVIVQRQRPRLDRFEPTTQRTIALLANLVLFIVTALFHLRHVPAEGRLVSRFLWDLLFSELVLWAIAPWFLALQRQALELADPLAASEDRRQVD